MIYIRRVELWKVALHYFASRLSTLSQNSAREDEEELVDEDGAIGVGIEDEGWLTEPFTLYLPGADDGKHRFPSKYRYLGARPSSTPIEYKYLQQNEDFDNGIQAICTYGVALCSQRTRHPEWLDTVVLQLGTS